VVEVLGKARVPSDQMFWTRKVLPPPEGHVWLEHQTNPLEGTKEVAYVLVSLPSSLLTCPTTVVLEATLGTPRVAWFATTNTSHFEKNIVGGSPPDCEK